MYSRGYNIDDDKPNDVLIDEACEVASDADVALIFAGLTEKYESEGYDRQHNSY